MTQPVVIFMEVQGLSELIRALKQVGNYPSYRVTNSLERALSDGFALTQGRVHVISGRLKASGTTESDFDGNVWSGSISYGGPKGSPAYYGVYEFARGNSLRRIPPHTPHNFYYDLPGEAGGAAMEKRFEDAIDEHFKAMT